MIKRSSRTIDDPSINKVVVSVGEWSVARGFDIAHAPKEAAEVLLYLFIYLFYFLI